MIESNCARVIFLRTELDASISAMSRGKSDGDSYCIRSAALAVNSRFLVNIKTLLPETLFADIVQAAMMLSNPDLLRKLSGKTIIIADAPESGVLTLVNNWVLGDVLQVQFLRGSFDDRSTLVLTDVTASEQNG